MLTYAATGQAPVPGDSSAALLYKVVHEEPELDSLSGELRAVAQECLAKDPAARPAPAEVSRRLAPEGAARLMAGGWLPGPLVERVSRSAVQLLGLDTGEPEPVRSGPVAFEGLSEGGTGVGTGTGTAAGAGEFGPAPVMGGPAPVMGPVTPVPSGTGFPAPPAYAPATPGTPRPGTPSLAPQLPAPRTPFPGPGTGHGPGECR